jgi:hypothetical protein
LIHDECEKLSKVSNAYDYVWIKNNGTWFVATEQVCDSEEYEIVEEE